MSEIGWEFNDEYYYQGENEGGTPIKVFLKRESAEKHKLELEREAVLELMEARELCGYGGSEGPFSRDTETGDFLRARGIAVTRNDDIDEDQISALHDQLTGKPLAALPSDEQERAWPGPRRGGPGNAIFPSTILDKPYEQTVYGAAALVPGKIAVLDAFIATFSASWFKIAEVEIDVETLNAC